MAKKKEEEETEATDLATKDLGALAPLAKVLKSTVGEVWKIFIKRYVAKGLAELFAAIVISGMSVVLLHITNWLWIPFPFVVVLMFDAIQLLVNPAYFALNDALERINDERKVEVVNPDSVRYR